MKAIYGHDGILSVAYENEEQWLCHINMKRAVYDHAKQMIV